MLFLTRMERESVINGSSKKDVIPNLSEMAIQINRGQRYAPVMRHAVGFFVLMGTSEEELMKKDPDKLLEQFPDKEDWVRTVEHRNGYVLMFYDHKDLSTRKEYAK